MLARSISKDMIQRCARYLQMDILAGLIRMLDNDLIHIDIPLGFDDIIEYTIRNFCPFLLIIIL